MKKSPTFPLIEGLKEFPLQTFIFDEERKFVPNYVKIAAHLSLHELARCYRIDADLYPDALYIPISACMSWPDAIGRRIMDQTIGSTNHRVLTGKDTWTAQAPPHFPTQPLSLQANIWHPIIVRIQTIG